MAIRDVLKISRKTFVNPSAWLDYESLRDQNRTIFSVLKNLFSKPKPGREETFAEAMQRQKLKENDVIDMQNNYQLYAYLFALLGFGAFFYAFYLIFRHGTLTGCLLSFATCSLFFAKAYEYDFWAMQLQRRTLGLTFADWKKRYLGE